MGIMFNSSSWLEHLQNLSGCCEGISHPKKLYSCGRAVTKALSLFLFSCYLQFSIKAFILLVTTPLGASFPFF